MTGSTVVVDNGDRCAVVTDHPDRVYLSVGGGRGGEAMFLNPVDALAIAAALIGAAGAVLESQFRRRAGSP